MSTINNVPDDIMLAAGRTTIGSRGGVAPLFVGVKEVRADSAPALANFALYELAHLKTDGTGVEKFVVGTSQAARAVVISQPVVAGQQAPYWESGYFNHEALVWPTDPSLDTYAERKAFFTGTPIKVGHCI
jgi:hypothetical protein